MSSQHRAELKVREVFKNENKSQLNRTFIKIHIRNIGKVRNIKKREHCMSIRLIKVKRK